jgi:hypothetical protein
MPIKKRKKYTFKKNPDETRGRPKVHNEPRKQVAIYLKRHKEMMAWKKYLSFQKADYKVVTAFEMVEWALDAFFLDLEQKFGVSFKEDQEVPACCPTCGK